MQTTTRFHDHIANSLLQEANLVFHHPVAFHPTNRVFNADSEGRDLPIVRVRRGGEFPPTRFFLGLEDRDPVQQKALDPHILVEPTAAWQGRAGPICQACIMRRAFSGLTQAAHVTGRIEHAQVVDRVALLLATVVVLLVLGSDGTVDRALRAILPQRGGVGPLSVRSAASHTASSSAVRAGSSPWWAQA